MKRSQGFTLLEIVIAMAIVAVAIVSIVGSVGSYTKNTAYLRDKVFAQWVASNVMNEYFLSEPTPKKGTEDGKMQMAGQDWSWVREIETAKQDGLFKVKIQVAKATEKDRTLSVLTSFVSDVIKYCPQQSNNNQQNTNSFGNNNSGC